MARSPSSNIRILLLERDKLKTLNKDPKTNSEIVPGTILCIYRNFVIVIFIVIFAKNVLRGGIVLS